MSGWDLEPLKGNDSCLRQLVKSYPQLCHTLRRKTFFFYLMSTSLFNTSSFFDYAYFLIPNWFKTQYYARKDVPALWKRSKKEVTVTFLVLRSAGICRKWRSLQAGSHLRGRCKIYTLSTNSMPPISFPLLLGNSSILK